MRASLTTRMRIQLRIKRVILISEIDVDDSSPEFFFNRLLRRFDQKMLSTAM